MHGWWSSLPLWTLRSPPRVVPGSQRGFKARLSGPKLKKLGGSLSERFLVFGVEQGAHLFFDLLHTPAGFPRCRAWSGLAEWRLLLHWLVSSLLRTKVVVW